MRTIFLWGGVAVVATVIFPFALYFLDVNVQLNQFEVQKNELRYGVISRETLFDLLKSQYLGGLNVLSNLFSRSSQVEFDKPESVFAYVWRHLPPYAVVYPTETYYYWRFTKGGETISGNLRLLDLDDGVMHMGYFHTNAPNEEGGYKPFSQKDGVSVEKVAPYRYRVTYDGKSVLFKMSDFFARPPEKLRMIPEEEFVARIWDESGMKFFLLFNRDTNSFYYVLDEEGGIPERFHEENDYFIGKRTGYAFYVDAEHDRKLLVGVHIGNIYANNYFDGPFDQVPPRLPIKTKLEAAYPYVAYNGGIDEHGNFLEEDGVRVAISPYVDYETIDDLREAHKECTAQRDDPLVFWSCLTYEPKKDFHKQLEAEGYPKDSKGFHAVFASQGWPANHSGEMSITWPGGHRADQSKIWSPNSLGGFSRE